MTPLYRILKLIFLLGSLQVINAQPALERELNELEPALDTPPPEVTEGPVIKLALLLDTSNSMDGLINQARSRIWNIVNEMGKARVDGKVPQIQVALFQYGNDGLSTSDDFVQLRCPFTTDLDIVSEQLFGLSTKGGSEYCGAVIRDAVQRLDWGQTRGGPTLRVVVIAGNEPFNQGTEPYAESISRARSLDIRVNTLYCGDELSGRTTLWADGARLGEGTYASIDQNQRIEEIPTPFDDAIFRLNEVLNGTYLGYGKLGKASLKRQQVQDVANSELSASAGLFRVQSKASSNYATASWDLVSAVEDGDVELEEVEEQDLPEELRKLNAKAREAKLEELAAKRNATQTEIRELSEKREQFLVQARKDSAEQSVALDDALIQALRGQASAMGFAFED